MLKKKVKKGGVICQPFSSKWETTLDSTHLQIPFLGFPRVSSNQMYCFLGFFFVFLFYFLTFSWIDKLHCSLPSLLSLGGGLGRILYLWLLIIKQYNNQPPSRGKTHILISPKCPHNLFFFIFFSNNVNNNVQGFVSNHCGGGL